MSGPEAAAAGLNRRRRPSQDQRPPHDSGGGRPHGDQRDGAPAPSAGSSTPRRRLEGARATDGRRAKRGGPSVALGLAGSATSRPGSGRRRYVAPGRQIGVTAPEAGGWVSSSRLDLGVVLGRHALAETAGVGPLTEPVGDPPAGRSALFWWSSNGADEGERLPADGTVSGVGDHGGVGHVGPPLLSGGTVDGVGPLRPPATSTRGLRASQEVGRRPP
jgi:hypothetical protein